MVGSVPWTGDDLDKRVVDKFNSIMVLFREEFSPSCEETRRMNVVKRVMES
jgi:hypothetical protein